MRTDLLNIGEEVREKKTRGVRDETRWMFEAKLSTPLILSQGTTKYIQTHYRLLNGSIAFSISGF